MRTFTDQTGRRWQVVVGRESWGAIFAIFVPEDGPSRTPEEGVRQSPLRAPGYREAHRELDGMSDDGLRELLARSEAKSRT